MVGADGKVQKADSHWKKAFVDGVKRFLIYCNRCKIFCDKSLSRGLCFVLWRQNEIWWFCSQCAHDVIQCADDIQVQLYNCYTLKGVVDYYPTALHAQMEFLIRKQQEDIWAKKEHKDKAQQKQR